MTLSGIKVIASPITDNQAILAVGIRDEAAYERGAVGRGALRFGLVADVYLGTLGAYGDPGPRVEVSMGAGSAAAPDEAMLRSEVLRVAAVLGTLALRLLGTEGMSIRQALDAIASSPDPGGLGAPLGWEEI